MCECRKPGLDLPEAGPARPTYLQGLSGEEWGQWLQLIRSKPRHCRCYSKGAIVKVTYIAQCDFSMIYIILQIKYKKLVSLKARKIDWAVSRNF